MSPRSLVPPFRESSAIMVASSTTTLPALSSSPTESSSGCLVRIPHLKTVKPNALSVPSIMSFALYYFRLAFHQLIGLRPSPPPHSSISFLPRHSPPLTWCCTGLRPPMSTSVSSGVNATPTSLPPFPQTRSPLLLMCLPRLFSSSQRLLLP